MSKLIKVEVTGSEIWRGGPQQTVTFASIVPFLDGGISEAALDLKRYRKGSPAFTYFVESPSGAVPIGQVELLVQGGSYANMIYSPSSSEAPQATLVAHEASQTTNGQNASDSSAHSAISTQVSSQNDATRIEALESQVAHLSSLINAMAKLFTTHV